MMIRKVREYYSPLEISGVFLASNGRKVGYEFFNERASIFTFQKRFPIAHKEAIWFHKAILRPVFKWFLEKNLREGLLRGRGATRYILFILI